MLIQLIFLTLALSLDSFGIGVSYGIRKINFKVISIFIISFMSLAFTSISVFLGQILSVIFSEKITSFFSIFLLIVLGLFIIKKGIEKNENAGSIKEPLNVEFGEDDNIYSFFIKSLGITINIIKTPSYGDLNHSSKIDPKEALFLGIALSMDSMGAGIAVSTFSYAFLFPLFIMLFQLMFLISGISIGKKIDLKFLDETKISIFSGIVIICIAFLRLIMS